MVDTHRPTMLSSPSVAVGAHRRIQGKEHGRRYDGNTTTMHNAKSLSPHADDARPWPRPPTPGRTRRFRGRTPAPPVPRALPQPEQPTVDHACRPAEVGHGHPSSPTPCCSVLIHVRGSDDDASCVPFPWTDSAGPRQWQGSGLLHTIMRIRECKIRNPSTSACAWWPKVCACMRCMLHPIYSSISSVLELTITQNYSVLLIKPAAGVHTQSSAN